MSARGKLTITYDAKRPAKRSGLWPLTVKLGTGGEIVDVVPVYEGEASWDSLLLRLRFYRRQLGAVAARVDFWSVTHRPPSRERLEKTFEVVLDIGIALTLAFPPELEPKLRAAQQDGLFGGTQ